MTQEELDVMDHPLFQRLKRVRQTGTLHLIAPSSVHTRFEHSIGVVSMADMLLEAVNRESFKIEAKLAPIREANPGEGVRFYELDEKDPVCYSQLRRVLRLAALVHDLGHGPLSHTFDSFAPSVMDIARLLADPRLAPIREYSDAILHSKSGRVEHEAVSVIMFTVIWDSLRGEDWMPRAVAAVLLNKTPVNIPRKLAPWISLIRDIVSSAPVDADRMDYLLRDSRVIGVEYGKYEKNRLLKSVLCVKSLEEHGGFRLGWRENCLDEVEDFIEARYRMFKRFYQHKTYRAAELMLAAIGQEAALHNLTVIDTTNLDTFVDGYTSMSDDTFLALLSGRWRPGFPGNDRIEKLSRQILDRKLWKRVFEYKRWRHTFAPEELLKALKEEYPDATFILDVLPIRAMKDLDRGAYLLYLNRKRRFYTQSTGSWLEASSSMRHLKEEEERTVRIFLEFDHTDPSVWSDIRERVFEICYDLLERRSS